MLIEYGDKLPSKLRNPMENSIQELNASPKLGQSDEKVKLHKGKSLGWGKVKKGR